MARHPTADCLLPVADHGIKNSEFRDLALCIAYHELNEIVLGDIPSFTQLNIHKRRSARILAQQRLDKVPKEVRERIAHEFVGLFLDQRERDLVGRMLRIINDKDSPVNRLYRVLDKIDPIIATWRYLHTYRGKLDKGAAEFLDRMKNFFEYPEVSQITARYKRDLRINELVAGLQNERLAADYYSDGEAIKHTLNPFGFDAQIAFEIIEGTSLIKRPQTAESRSRRFDRRK
jgi:5'-deoxynucleotidase YfbR-like HD superfamily hydrolase